MADSYFDLLQLEAFRKGIAPRTEQSRQWFMNKLKEMKNINRRALLKDDRLIKRNKFGAGQMYMFFYDPKHRQTLPYYDSFPLVVAVEPAKGGFYGLNLHYLPPKLRAIMFDRLLETTNNKRYDESTKFKLDYQLLKGMSKLKYYKPCFKHYLYGQVEGMVMVQPAEWEVALFMPTQQFNKASQTKVWAESRKMSK